MNKTIFILFITSLVMLSCDWNIDKESKIKPASFSNDIAEANLKLGVAYLKSGDYERSLAKLKKAQKADPYYSPIYNALGVLHQQIGEGEIAERYYRKALSLDDSNASTLNNYGQFLCGEGRYDEAEQLFLKAANDPLYTTPEVAFSNAGSCALAQDRAVVAESYFRQALQKNPNITIALLQMSRISYDSDNYLSARAYLQRYLDNNSHTPESLWLGIKIEENLGDKDALASYKLLLRNKFPDSKEAALLGKQPR